VGLLRDDARRTQKEIAGEVGLSQPSVADRIRKLEEAGVVLGYHARIDPRMLGDDITAFIGVGIEHPKYFDSFARKVSTISAVLECHRVAGADSYLLKVRCQNTSALDSLLVETLRTIPGVTRTQTTIVLASTKEDGQVRSNAGGDR